MDDEPGPGSLDTWIDRTRRMIGYEVEARDFVRRAGERFPTLESDAGAVCLLWALADEQDEAICHALTRYDLDLFGTAGELDVTRGAEARTGPGGGETIAYLCRWEIRRPDNRWVSVVLLIEQVSQVLMMEVRDSSGAAYPLRFPVQDTSGLHEALSGAFFTISNGE